MRIFQDIPLNDPIKLFTSRPIHIERPYCPISICSTTNRVVTRQLRLLDAVWSRCSLGHHVPLVHHLVFIYPFYGFTCWFWKSKLMIPILNIQDFKYLQYYTENILYPLLKDKNSICFVPLFSKILKNVSCPHKSYTKMFHTPDTNTPARYAG